MFDWTDVGADGVEAWGPFGPASSGHLWLSSRTFLTSGVLEAFSETCGCALDFENPVTSRHTWGFETSFISRQTWDIQT